MNVHNFAGELRHMNVTPHVAQNDTNLRGAIDQRPPVTMDTG